MTIKSEYMVQLVINVENENLLPHLKKVLKAIDGISIAKSEKKKRKSGIEKAYEDIRAGRISHYESVDDKQ